MYIKIWRPSPVAVSSEVEPGDKKFREISWLVIETTRFTRDMYPRDGVEGHFDYADEYIMRVRPPLPEGVELEYNEVCVLRCQAPEALTVVFDTEAYICNERGDTIEKIVPLYRVKPGTLKPFNPHADGDYTGPYGCWMCNAIKPNVGLCPSCTAEPMSWGAATRGIKTPCLLCGEQADSLFVREGALAEWIGSINCKHSAHGHVTFKDRVGKKGEFKISTSSEGIYLNSKPAAKDPVDAHAFYDGPFKCPYCKTIKESSGSCPKCEGIPNPQFPVLNHTSPCLKCEKTVPRLYRLFNHAPAEWMGTLCTDCGEQTWEMHPVGTLTIEGN